jgi:DnaK suppressor protein
LRTVKRRRAMPRGIARPGLDLPQSRARMHALPSCKEMNMDLETQSHLTTLRQLLLFRLHDLRADLRTGRIDEEVPVAAEVGDTKDGAQHQQFAAIRDAEERRDIDELVSIEAALHRLDSGNYGNCFACGEPIALQRLLVQPAALRCAPCQAALEHGRARLT